MKMSRPILFLLLTALLMDLSAPCATACPSHEDQPVSADVVPRDQLPYAVMLAMGWRISPYSPEGLEWTLRGAEEGDVYAQFDMGKRYYEGLGVPVDFAEAEKWFRIAAGNGHEKAQAMLDLMREKGQIAEKLPEEPAEAPESQETQGDESPAE